jgi:hypothetical protein
MKNVKTNKEVTVFQREYSLEHRISIQLVLEIMKKAKIKSNILAQISL